MHSLLCISLNTPAWKVGRLSRAVLKALGPDRNKNAAVMSGWIVQTSQPNGGGRVGRRPGRQRRRLSAWPPAAVSSAPGGRAGRPTALTVPCLFRPRPFNPDWFFVDDIEFSISITMVTYLGGNCFAATWDLLYRVSS